MTTDNVAPDTTDISATTGSDDQSVMDTNVDASSSDGKKTKNGDANGASALPAPDLNFPLPSETGLACQIKVRRLYDALSLFSIHHFCN